MVLIVHVVEFEPMDLISVLLTILLFSSGYGLIELFKKLAEG